MLFEYSGNINSWLLKIAKRLTFAIIKSYTFKDTHRESTLKLNSSGYEKYEYGHYFENPWFHFLEESILFLLALKWKFYEKTFSNVKTKTNSNLA